MVMISFEISRVTPSGWAHCLLKQNHSSVSRREGRNESGQTTSACCLRCSLLSSQSEGGRKAEDMELWFYLWFPLLFLFLWDKLNSSKHLNN